MDQTINPGITGKLEKIVEPKDSAAIMGSGTIDVFSTPAMIAFMEQTAMQSVQSFLPEGFSTVGTEINVQHLKATAIGKTVFCESKLIAVSGREMKFEIIASDKNGIIGKGSHTRVVIDIDRFLSHL